MPVFLLKNKTLRWFFKKNHFLLLSVIIKYFTSSFYTDCSLNSFMMTMATTNRPIHSIYIKYSFYFKRQAFLYNRQVTSFISKSFKIKKISHIKLPAL